MFLPPRQESTPMIPGLGGDEVKSPKAVGPRVPIKQPCILIFDSLSGGQRASIVATLRWGKLGEDID